MAGLDEPGLDPAGEVGGFVVGSGEQQHVFAAQVVGEPRGGGALAGGFGVGGPDPAVPVVDGDHAGLPGAQPYRRGGFPRRGEAADLGQLRGRNLPGQEPEHASGLG